MKRILVIGYLEQNFGDDLFFKILFERYKNVEWTLESENTSYLKIFSEFNNVRLIKKNILNKIISKFQINNSVFYNEYDAVVYIGGSIFIQHSGWQKQLEERKNLIKYFHKKGKKTFILGSNFGPYDNDIFYKEYENLFNYCTDICFRDSQSYNKFIEFKNIRLKPDIVFQLKANNVTKIKDSIGLSIIDLENRRDLNKYKNDYEDKIKELVEMYAKEKYIVKLFSFCKNEGDRRVIDRIVDLIDEKYTKQIKIIEYNDDIEYFLCEFNSVESIIGTRFHSVILSQVFNQGIYPLIYSDKTYNVLKDINLDKECMYIKNIKNLDIQHVYNIIKDNKIKDKSIFKEAEKQFEGLDRYVEDNR